MQCNLLKQALIYIRILLSIWGNFSYFSLCAKSLTRMSPLLNGWTKMTEQGSFDRWTGSLGSISAKIDVNGKLRWSSKFSSQTTNVRMSGERLALTCRPSFRPDFCESMLGSNSGSVWEESWSGDLRREFEPVDGTRKTISEEASAQ